MSLLLAMPESDAPAMVRTVAASMAFGVLLILIARKLDFPAIVLLLGGGILLGPAILGDHAIVQPASLGDGLPVLVALAVGLILFDGGLTLDLEGYRQAPAMIKRLLTIGVLITWAGAAGAAMLLTDIEPKYAILAASMVVVTGPTVIAPLLKRLRVTERVHSILHWEGVLIDPIGVFLAVLTFELVVSGVSGQQAATGFALRIAAGLGVGIAAGMSLAFVTRRGWIPEDMLNIVAVACAMLAFGLAEVVRTEAGLLAVTVAGFVFGVSGPKRVKQIRAFKAELTDLLIGTLFMLLSARLSFEQFQAFGWEGALAVAVVLLLARPLSIHVCSAGLGLAWQERAFLSWVAPRGIVAASMASLFAISIKKASPEQAAAADFIETFVYSVIMSTIVLQGLTAGPLSRALGLRRTDPPGWLLVGAHRLGCRIAEFLRDGGIDVLIADTNPRLVRDATQRGLPAIVFDARDVSLSDRPEFHGIGNLLALTDNEDLNVRLCETWNDPLGRTHTFRCNPTQRDEGPDAGEIPGTLVWPRLPRPTLLAGELDRGQASLLIDEDGDPTLSRLATPVLTRRGHRVTFAPPGDQPIEDDPRTVLYLQRTAEHLLWSVHPELVLDLECPTLGELFARILEPMVGVVPNLNREEAMRELLDRESAFPTVIGHGVALPHAYASGLARRLCAIVRVRGGIQFGDDGGGPVRLVFLLLSPHGDPEGHLATLAEIARLVLDADVREKLLEARSPLEVIGIVGEHAKRAP